MTDIKDITALNVRMSQEYRKYLDLLSARMGMSKPEVIEAAIIMLAKTKGYPTAPSRLGNQLQTFITKNQ